MATWDNSPLVVLSHNNTHLAVSINGVTSPLNTLTERLRLATRRDVERKLLNLIDFYREVYRDVVLLGERLYNPLNLVLTQDYLESDKLALVLRSVLLEGYVAPVIVVVGEGGEHYVVDGHHRVLVNAWLRRNIQSYTLMVRRYRPRTRKTLLSIDVINPHDTPEDLLCWRHAVNTIRFLEKEHNILARVWIEKLPVTMLMPTQPSYSIGDTEVTTGSEYCPVLVYKVNDRFYVVDGHHRVCKAIYKEEGFVDSLVFTLEDIEVGLVKTARKLGLNGFTHEYCRGLPRCS